MVSNEFIARLDKWDQKIILKYNGVGGKAFTYILKPISFLGRETLWISLITFYLLIWYDPFLFSHFSAVFFNGIVLILSIKKIVKRSRPYDKFNDDKLHVLERRPISKSFPSWHSYNIVSYGLLFGFLLNSPLVIIVMLLIATIVSFSRIQLGVHYPTDVIFGYFLGIIGFIFAVYIVSPLFNMLITYFEQFFTHDIQYQQINTMLFKNFGYLFLSISIFLGIFLLAISRIIKEYLKK